MAKPNTIKRRWLKEDESAIDAAIATLLETKDGRKFVWWLLELSHVGGQPFSDNALRTAFSCGELNVGNQVLARLVAVRPDGYVQMMQEQANERSVRDAELSGAGADADPDDFDYGPAVERRRSGDGGD